MTSPLEHGQLPDRCFQKIHIDIVGPLPRSQDKTYLLTIIDCYTRWPEAIPMADATTATCARALLSSHIAQFGVPADISSDRGPQFTSNLWTTLNSLMGVQLHRTTAYHPQANGIIERLHRQLKASLKARLTGPDWMDEISLVLLGLRSVLKRTSDVFLLSLSIAQLSAYQGNFLKLPRHPPN